MRVASIGKKVAVTLQAVALTGALGVASLVVAGPVSADCDTSVLNLQNGANCAQANGTSSNLFANGGIFQTASNTLIFLVGAIAVIYLIIGGLRYVISNGDAKHVEAAKNTILYAIVGIVVAIISFALVQFVISSLGKAS